MLNRIIIAAILSVSVISCGNGTTETQKNDTEQQNRFVHEVLLDRYLWYQQVDEDIDYANFDSPEQLLDFLRADEDRFSYISDAAEFNSLFGEGQYIGYGFSTSFEKDGTVLFKFVYRDSAAGRAGLTRGDQILSINGESVEEISATLGWQDVFGARQEGIPVDMVVRKKDGSTTDVHMLKSVVNINTVLYSEVIDNGAEKIGYLVFNSFLRTSSAELATVFNEFNAQGVTRVILDLRYNRGGSVFVAKDLGSYLYDNATSGQIFTTLEQNDKHQELNSTYYFETRQNELDLQQLVVLTTGLTASASEMIINSLKPFVDVKTVGSRTYGKPVGMNSFQFADKVILPITFAVYNSQHEGGYFAGIEADCPAADDVRVAFGDRADPMLAQALSLTQSGLCLAAKPAQSRAYRKPSSSRPSLQDFIGAY